MSRVVSDVQRGTEECFTELEHFHTRLSSLVHDLLTFFNAEIDEHEATITLLKKGRHRNKVVQWVYLILPLGNKGSFSQLIFR